MNTLGNPYAICFDSKLQQIYECTCYNCICNDSGDHWFPTLAYRLKYERECLEDEEHRQRVALARGPPCNRHILLTISLNPKNFNLDTILDWIPNLSIIEDHAIWSFEFYGKDLKFHPHIHLLIKTTKKLNRKRIIEKLSSQFNVAPNFIDYKTGNNKHLLTKRVNYIKGIKSSIKDAQINADQKFRDEKNIKDFYSL